MDFSVLKNRKSSKYSIIFVWKSSHIFWYIYVNSSLKATRVLLFDSIIFSSYFQIALSRFSTDGASGLLVDQPTRQPHRAWWESCRWIPKRIRQMINEGQKAFPFESKFSKYALQNNKPSNHFIRKSFQFIVICSWVYFSQIDVTSSLLFNRFYKVCFV